MKTSATLLLCLLVGRAAAAPSVASIESAYADLTNAYGALGLIDSGFAPTHAGRSREEWARTFEAKRAAVTAGLGEISMNGLSPQDARAVTVMRESLAALVEEKSLAPVRKCSEAQQKDLDS